MKKDNFWYIVSYPKSGNTWCRVFIKRLLDLKEQSQLKKDCNTTKFDINRDLKTGEIISNRNWIDDQLGIESSDLTKMELDPIRFKLGSASTIYGNSLRFHKVHDMYKSPYSNGNPVVSNKCLGAIYIVRNPLDIVISLKHFFNFDIEESIDFILNENSQLNSHHYQANQFLGSWGNHVLSWTEQKDIPLLVIKYEDLLNSPNKYFFQISKFLELSESQKLVDKAIKESSFKKLQKLEEEEEGGFIEKPKSCKKFFRSGRIGEGVKLLDEKQIKRITDSFKYQLDLLRYDLNKNK